MAVNTSEITSIYTTLFNSAVTNYDNLYSSDKIDAETYASLVGQVSSQLLQLSADLVQKQESIDKDIEIKERQMIIQESQSIPEVTAKEYQIEIAKSELNKINYEVSTLLVDQHNINIAQKSKVEKDIELSELQYVSSELTAEKQRNQLDAQTDNTKQELDNLKVMERKIKSDVSKNMMDVSVAQSQVNMNKTNMLNEFKLKNAQRNLIAQQALSEVNQTSVLANQAKLLEKQTKGFENNMHKEKAKMSLEAIGLLAQAEVTSEEDMAVPATTDTTNPYAKIVAAYSAGLEDMTKW